MPNGVAKFIVGESFGRVETEENISIFENPEDAAVHVLTSVIALSGEHDPCTKLLDFLRQQTGYDLVPEADANAEFNNS